MSRSSASQITRIDYREQIETAPSRFINQGEDYRAWAKRADQWRKTANPFWVGIFRILKRIEREKPDTAKQVASILKQSPTSDGIEYAGDAFFAGSSGDDQLDSYLVIAGWEMLKAKASYYWIMKHPITGSTIGYIEGDLYIDPKPETFFH